jgi:hypothetical protein
MTSITCSSCHAKLTIRGETAGKRIRCPRCNQSLTSAMQVDARVPTPVPTTLFPPLMPYVLVSLLCLALGGTTGFIAGHLVGGANTAQKVSRLTKELSDSERIGIEHKERLEQLGAQVKLVEERALADKGISQATASNLNKRNEELSRELVLARTEQARAKEATRRLEEQLAAIKNPKPVVVGGGLRMVTPKEIETFGEDLLRQPCQMVCVFLKLDDTWVRLLLADDRYVGIYLEDSNGQLFQYAFAKKDAYGRKLLNLARGTEVLLTGNIRRINDTFAFFADEIEWPVAR